jgi:hypothetical protein
MGNAGTEWLSLRVLLFSRSLEYTSAPELDTVTTRYSSMYKSLELTKRLEQNMKQNT